jgi:serine/threonine protein kinase
MENHITNERSVMSVMDSDFVVRMYGSYQDKDNIFFLLECVTGGELFDVYCDKNLFGNQPHAKFYIACVALALEHMHAKRVIYRDLKLENCLLDSLGYCKLTDMGIAKIVLGKTYTICGTADYFAPETLKQTGHNRAVDWWAAGVLLFLMVVGRTPFDAEDVTQIYKNIIKGFSKVKFPASVPVDLSDVIKSLCRKKPEERVPMAKGGVEALKAMPWFLSLSWYKLLTRELETPFVPEPLNYDKIAAKKLTRDFELDVKKTQVWDGAFETQKAYGGVEKGPDAAA